MLEATKSNMGQDFVKSNRTTPIRSSLIRLVMVCVLPAVALVAALIYQQYQQGRGSLIKSASGAARATVLAVDQDFQSAESSLRALATSPSLKQQDWAGFHQQASELSRGPIINNFVLIDPAGRQVVNTARPFGEPLSTTANPGQYSRVLASGQRDISNLFIGAAIKRPLIGVAVPVRQGTMVTHSLGGGILASYFQTQLKEQQLLDEQIVTLIDASGVIVARSREIDRFIGTNISLRLRQALQSSDDEGFYEGVNLEGIPVLVVFARSPISRWTVVVGTPIDVLTRDLRRSLWLLTGFVALLFSISLGLAWFLGGRVNRSLVALVPPAAALGHGQAVVVPQLSIREADEVGRAITLASARLADAGAALFASEERMRGIVESAMDAIITVDADQHIVLYNRAAERIFGWSGEQVLGKRLEMLMPERFRAGHTAHVERFSATGTTSRGMGDGTLIYGQRASGQEFPLEASISQLDTAGGKMFSVILRDVTARVRAHDALERSNLDLQQFAYVASHDLKTPLRSIGGFVQILERNYGDRLDEKAIALIHRTSDAVRRLEHLTEDLLSYARVNSEMRPFAPVDCSEVIGEVIHLLNAAIEDTGAVVTAGELPVVMGDRTQLVQLFLNLVGNGIKYCRYRAPIVHVSATKGNREWLFSVTDNGIGIEAKHHDRIFEIFKRLHTQKEYSGTGIGLAVCRRVVERHGGEIGLTSVPGKGSTFTFTLKETSVESTVP